MLLKCASSCACPGFDQTRLEYCGRLSYLKMRICTSSVSICFKIFLPCCSNVSLTSWKCDVFPTNSDHLLSLGHFPPRPEEERGERDGLCSHSPAQKVLSSCQPSRLAYQLPGSVNACSQSLSLCSFGGTGAPADSWNTSAGGAFCLFWGWWSTAWTALLHQCDGGTISLFNVCPAAFTTSCGWLVTTGWRNQNYTWKTTLTFTLLPRQRHWQEGHQSC